MNTNYYDYMKVKDLKEILNDLPDEMIIVIPVIDEDDVNHIYGFRKVRTASVLDCKSEQETRVFCLNSAMEDQDIADQVFFSGRDVDAVEVLYGYSKYEGDQDGRPKTKGNYDAKDGYQDAMNRLYKAMEAMKNDPT